MKKIIFSCVLLVSLFSCNQEKKQKSEAAITSKKIGFNAKKLPTIGSINVEATEKLVGWVAFSDFETSFKTFYKSKNKEDLDVTLDDLIEKQKALAKSEHPEVFDKNHIKSRLKVCKVYILKLKAALYYGLDIQPVALELTRAHNAYLNQFNVTVNSIIDPSIILALDE